MIDTTTLRILVNGYLEQCRTSNHKPTYKGMAIVLGISGRTISNVAHGTYNGHLYSDTPHITRCIDNNDFELIKGIYANPCE